MASRRKLPLVLFLITLVLLAGAVVLLLRGVLSRWSASRPGRGYAITGQEEATVTPHPFQGSRCRRAFLRRSPSARLRESWLPLLQDGDTTFYLTAFARSDEDPAPSTPSFSRSISSPGRGTASPPYRIDEDGGITAQLPGFRPARAGRRRGPPLMRPGWPARAW